MSTKSRLREKLRKIEALFASSELAGERLAAEATLERARARLAQLGQRDPPVEMQCSMPDQWTNLLKAPAMRGAPPSKMKLLGLR